MIGVFDSGLGGLTVLRALASRFPNQAFTYLGDHANVPYGERESNEIVALTKQAVETLFKRDCRLVLLGCNTATAVAARHLQQAWLPNTRWHGEHNILGIVAPTVEAATQTPWAVTTPQYPQKNISDSLVVFGTTRTISSGVFSEEIRKRCPKMRVVEQACPGLAGAIESGANTTTLQTLVSAAVTAAIESLDGEKPDRAILGCTHFPLIEDLFVSYLPAETRILSQPDCVAHSLEDYLARHSKYLGRTGTQTTKLFTTGDPKAIDLVARRYWPQAPAFEILPS